MPGPEGGDDLQPRPRNAAATGSGEGVAGPPAQRPTSRSIARSELEQVIRRAAELSIRDADADEQLSEDEVLRIATELGLPAHHVRRALFELPELSVRGRWYDRYFEPPVFTVARVVPGRSQLTLRRIEEYLVTREYLQIVRRRGENLALVPADDTISSLARAFFRPGSKHHLARAKRVLVGVHAIPEGDAHVRIDVDLSQDRSGSVKGATVAGILGGTIAGGIAAGIASGVAGPILGPVPEILAFGGGMAATIAAAFSIAASRFRNRLYAAKFEVTGLLDRLEHGERLEPPPAPWRRRLQSKFLGGRDDTA
jgi:hypothetical protein